MTVSHTRGDIYRAALESTALGVRHNIETFRVLGHDGVQNFHVVLGLYSGKPELKHTIFGARDGSGVFNMEENTLDSCSVVAADVAVVKEGAGPPAKP